MDIQMENQMAKKMESEMETEGSQPMYWVWLLGELAGCSWGMKGRKKTIQRNGGYPPKP